MKVTTGRKPSMTASKAFVEESITPVFPEYPECREGETRPRMRYRVHICTNSTTCFVDF